jgi:hypothetical protein
MRRLRPELSHNLPAISLRTRLLSVCPAGKSKGKEKETDAPLYLKHSTLNLAPPATFHFIEAGSLTDFEYNQED